MILKRTFDKHFTFLSLLIVLAFIPQTTLAQTTSTDLTNQLNSSPLYNHRSIYRQVINDTTFLEDNELRLALLDVGEKWLVKYLYPLRFEQIENLPDWVTADSIPRVFGDYVTTLANISNATENYRALELKMFLLSNSVSWSEILTRQIKRDPNTLAILLKSSTEFQYEDIRKSHLLFGGRNVHKAIYEAYKLHRSRVPQQFVDELIRWAEKAVTDPDNTSALKTSAIAILLEEGRSKDWIRNNYKFDRNHPLFSNSPWTFEGHLSKEIKDAEKLQQEYPQFQLDIDESELPKLELEVQQSPGKSHTAPGHNRDKLPEESRENPPGHERGKGKGHR